MQRAPVVGRGDRDRRDPELAARAEDAQRDLAAVRDQELPDRHRADPMSSGSSPPHAAVPGHSAAVALLCCLPEAGAGTLFLIDGRGWGHGVGMSQYGARGYAQAGWTYQRILAHYYRGHRPAPPSRAARSGAARGRGPAVRIPSTKPFRVADARGKTRRLKPGAQNVAAAELRRCGRRCATRPGAAPLLLDGKAYRGELVVHRRRHAHRRQPAPARPLPPGRRAVGDARRLARRRFARRRSSPAHTRSRSSSRARSSTSTRTLRSQVYGGIEAEAVSTNRAVGATAGRVLFWGGRVATTFYHSTSGGRTISVRRGVADATPVPYLVSVPDPYDRISKLHRWGPVRLTPAEPGGSRRRRSAGPPRRARPVRGAPEVTIKGRAGARRLCSAQDFRARPRPPLDLVQRPRARSRPACGVHLRAAAGHAGPRVSCAASVMSSSSNR